MRLKSLALSMVMAVPSLVFLAEPAFATHFRFGNVTWQPRPDVSPTTVEFTLTAGFRRSGYAGSAADGRPAVGDTITELIGDTRLFPGDGTSIGSPLQFEVIAINPTQDWLLAKAERTGPGDPDKVLLHAYPSASNGGSPWVARIDTCCRITTSDHINNSSGNYRVETLVDLRSLNGPPITSLPPIVSCELDSVCQFVVPASDADGDPIRFRLATSCEAASGCGFAQPGPPHAPNVLSIDATTGIATWDTTNARIASGFGYGLYSAQVIVEDLGSDGAAKSKTAVDFLIRVAPAPPFAPRFDSPPSPPQGAVFNIGRGETLTIPVQASDPESGDVVTLGDAGLPAGMVCSYGAPSNPVSGSCTWSPSATQSGNHLVVFTATDNHGVGAPPLSVTVLVSLGRYVALGDSISYGHGLANPKKIESMSGLPTNQGPSSLAWPSLLARSQGLTLRVRQKACTLELDQLAVSGATAHRNNTQGEMWEDCPTRVDGNGDAVSDSPHPAILPDELGVARLADNPPSLVTIMIGANDLDFAWCLPWEVARGIASMEDLARVRQLLRELLDNPESEAYLTPAQVRWIKRFVRGINGWTIGTIREEIDDNGCIQGADLKESVARRMIVLENSLRQIINRIEADAPSASIVVVNYFQIVPVYDAELEDTGSVLCHALRGIDSNARSTLRLNAEFLKVKLNRSIAKTVDRFPEVTSVDLARAYDGHEMCAADSWVFDGPIWRIAHPNEAGQRVIASAVQASCAIRSCTGRAIVLVIMGRTMYDSSHTVDA